MNQTITKRRPLEWIPVVNCVFAVIIVSCLGGCASSPVTQSDPPTLALANPPHPSNLNTNQEIEHHETAFKGQLPLGFGAKLDLFVSDTADQLSEAYKSVIIPLRKGKLFSRKAYEVEYSILPKKGDDYSYKSKTDSYRFRSDYDFRIGMSRRFHQFADFLKGDFWLAKGKYSPSSPVRANYRMPPQVITFEESSKVPPLDFNLTMDNDDGFQTGLENEELWYPVLEPTINLTDDSVRELE